MQRPVRRRQRPEWDDNLTAIPPQADRVTPREGPGGLGPRPTAKELLQEALARIQSASSPRPQHAKRQRRSMASQQGQPCSAVPHHQRGTDKLPQWQFRPQQGSGHSWGDATTATRPSQGAQHACGHSWGGKATAARAPQGAGPAQVAQQQAAVAVQPHKHHMVKQPAFGSKPSWVTQSSASASAIVTAGERGGDTQPSGVHCCMAYLTLTCGTLRTCTVFSVPRIPTLRPPPSGPFSIPTCPDRSSPLPDLHPPLPDVVCGGGCAPLPPQPQVVPVPLTCSGHHLWFTSARSLNP